MREGHNTECLVAAVLESERNALIFHDFPQRHIRAIDKEKSSETTRTKRLAREDSTDALAGLHLGHEALKLHVYTWG